MRREERTNRVSRQIQLGARGRKEPRAARDVWPELLEFAEPGKVQAECAGTGGETRNSMWPVQSGTRVDMSGGRRWMPGVWGMGGRARGTLVPGVEAKEWLRSPGEGPEPCKA